MKLKRKRVEPCTANFDDEMLCASMALRRRCDIRTLLFNLEKFSVRERII